MSNIAALSTITEALLCPPFEWRLVKGGFVTLEDASERGGTLGGVYQVADFAMAKYPITNAQYQKFLDSPNGFSNPQWWDFSPEATQWRKDHPKPKPTAFGGADLPRTRVSWFDSLAFCGWLIVELDNAGGQNLKLIESQDPLFWRIRLPTEQEWQRAALGDTGWRYPWGNELEEKRANYALNNGQPNGVQKYPQGASVFGVMDMIGNVWEWCLTAWGSELTDISGYTYRIIRGGAWNIKIPDHLCANDRGSHPPRGRLNDCGFRCVLLV